MYLKIGKGKQVDGAFQDSRVTKVLKSYNKMLTGVHNKNPEALQGSEVPSELSEEKKVYFAQLYVKYIYFNL